MDLNGMKKIFCNRDGALKRIWLLCLVVGLYLAAPGAVYYVYWTLWRSMEGAWGVTSRNIYRAPDVIRFLYSWSNVIVTILRSALLIAAGRGLLRWTGVPDEKMLRKVRGTAIGTGLGAAGIVLAWSLLLLTGSVRLGWRLSRPQFTINTFALVVTTLTLSLGEGCYLYGAALKALKKRLPIWAARGVVALMGTMAVNAFSWVGWINGALMATMCCLMAERFGMGAAIGFRFSWFYIEQAILGFAGATAALYETYPVNLYWLNGGNAGLINGLIVTLLLTALTVWLLREEIARFSIVKNKFPS